MLFTELRKLYGGLRNDDAQWTCPGDWEIEFGILEGECLKAKATEATARRVRETMPMVMPLHGVSKPQVHWYERIWQSMLDIGVRREDGYAVPYAVHVQGGVRAPGAAPV